MYKTSGISFPWVLVSPVQILFIAHLTSNSPAISLQTWQLCAVKNLRQLPIRQLAQNTVFSPLSITDSTFPNACSFLPMIGSRMISCENALLHHFDKA
jgi:hypothetical protein